MKAVVLAGGEGTSVGPYATVLPKPLMPVGDIPIIDVMLQQLARAGFREIVLSVGHLADLLVAYCGDGARWNVKIRYSREEEPLGTAGPLGIIRDLSDTFLVMNGDLLTNIDYRALVACHRAERAMVTVGVCEKQVRMDLGVVETDDQANVTAYVEKPVMTYLASMGIYAMERSVLGYLPARKRYDLPDLVKRLILEGQKVAVHRTAGHWLDIGRQEDYAEAVSRFTRERAQFLPDEPA